MKVIAYYALHYGAEYLAWSVRSIQSAVDEIHVLYSERPSFGHGTSFKCPETEADVYREAHRFLTKPLFWHKGTWPNEGAHRDSIYKIAQNVGSDIIVVVDADEIWDPDELVQAIDIVRTRSEKNVLVRFIHFWRSLNWCCEDPCMPVRLIRPNGKGDWYLSPQDSPVFHFGYAQSPNLIQYKMEIHGHKNEWRQEWFLKKFIPWTPDNNLKDVHPTNLNFWNPKTLSDKHHKKISQLLGDHPYQGRVVI